MGSMSIMGDRGRLTTCLTLGFRVHPNYGNEVRRQYNQILHDLAQSNILQFMVQQFAGQDTVVNKLGDQIAPKILEANYSLS